MYMRRRQDLIVDFVVIMLVVCIVALPMVLVLRQSFGMRGFGNYIQVYKTGILRNVINSGIITLGTIFIVLCIVCPAAYAFSKFRFGFSKFLYYVSILGMMIPSVVMLVPIMVLGKTLHLMNSLIGVILPLSAMTAPFMLLILKNAIDDHPLELYEAAHVDGCSFFRMLFSIVLPMSKPTILVIILFVFMNGWNEYFLPLALLRNPQLMTVTIIPSRFAEEFGQDVPKIFAASVMMVLPVVVVYLAIQPYFEQGFTTGAIKG
jgi:raffinose/stachyose/melibiose transport system permease protein